MAPQTRNPAAIEARGASEIDQLGGRVNSENSLTRYPAQALSAIPAAIDLPSQAVAYARHECTLQGRVVSNTFDRRLVTDDTTSGTIGQGSASPALTSAGASYAPRLNAKAPAKLKTRVCRDNRDRGGRKSWDDFTNVLERHPRLLATVVETNVAGLRRTERGK